MKYFTLILAALFVSPLFAATEQMEMVQHAILQNNAQWQTGQSWVASLTPEEFQKLCGTSLDKPDAESSELLTLNSAATLPSQFDWRDNSGDWLTSVKNQANCGSCWDFSATAQVEAWWQIFYARPDSNIDLSEQFVLSCGGAGSCDGGLVELALDFYQQNGVPLETCMPYQANDDIDCGAACDDWAARSVTIPGWGYVTLDEPIVENIKQAVLRHPVSASYTVYEDFQYYAGGVYEHVWGDVVAGHAILIVGWDDADECWIVKNSWGPNWGEDGYFRIKWGDSGMGTYVPFIYDNLTKDAIAVSDQEFNIDLISGQSTQQEISLQNLSDLPLQYALMDYEIPMVFHPDVFNAYDGLSWWCGDPQVGGYSNHWLQYLDTPALDLSGTAQPQLDFQTFWAIEPPDGATPPWDGWDGANVWVSTDSGKTFSVISPTTPEYTSASLWAFGEPDQGWDLGPNIPGWAGSSDGWIPAHFDLSDYRSPHTIIRFAFASDMGFSSMDDEKITGFFVDNIQVSDARQTIYSNSANDPNGMQRLGFGIGPASWLHLQNNAGTLAPGASQQVLLDISAVNKLPGSYAGQINIASNDTSTPLQNIDIHLNVQQAQHDLALSLPQIPKSMLIRSSFTPALLLQNSGSADAQNISVSCSISKNGDAAYSQTQTIAVLPTSETAEVNLKTWVAPDTGMYHLTAEIKNAVDDASPLNNVYSDSFYVTSLVDDFEHQTDRWDMRGGWGLTDSYEGFESDFAAHVNGGQIPYKANMNAIMTYKSSFDIANTDSVTFSFQAWSYVDSDQDYCVFEVSADSMQWVEVDRISNQNMQYQPHHVEVSSALPAHADQVWARFRFVSDAQNESIGIFIDQFEFYATPAQVPTLAEFAHTAAVAEWSLAPNYPNPFNPTTTISYSLGQAARIHLTVYNIAGQQIATLVNDRQTAGAHTAIWDASVFPSGVYFYKITAMAEQKMLFQAFKKMLLVK